MANSNQRNRLRLKHLQACKIIVLYLEYFIHIYIKRGVTLVSKEKDNFENLNSVAMPQTHC